MMTKPGNMKNMTDVLEIIKGVAIFMKEGGVLVAADTALEVQKIQTWMIILLRLISVKVIGLQLFLSVTF